MKGIVLAGGNGRRLAPLTDVVNKHLLPVYNQPMIFYPIQTLVEGGINEILIVSSNDHAGSFLRLLGSGKRFGAELSYRVQEGAGGIAQALSLAESFAGGENCAVILGDNIFENDFSDAIKNFQDTAGAHLFLKQVPDANRFGVAEIEGSKVLGIEEKPKKPKSYYAVTGLYLYDSHVFDIIRTLRPSKRNELEITDVNNGYIQRRQLEATVIEGSWTDSGMFESLFRANVIARKITLRKKMNEEKLSHEEMNLIQHIEDELSTMEKEILS